MTLREDATPGNPVHVSESVTVAQGTPSLIERLRKRAEIRRNIPRGEPDRISDILEEAAAEVAALSAQVVELQKVLVYARGALMELSPCMNPECEQIQRETLEWAIKKIDGFISPNSDIAAPPKR